MEVDIDDIAIAIDFVSGCSSLEPEAFLDQEAGEIFYSSADGADENFPTDVYENDRYILIPSEQDLDLGRSLAIAFSSQELANELDSVYAIFHRKGAYSKFRALLVRTGSLEKWYAFEAESTKKAIKQWYSEQGLKSRK